MNNRSTARTSTQHGRTGIAPGGADAANLSDHARTTRRETLGPAAAEAPDASAPPGLCAVQLTRRWSPEQIARRLQAEYPDDPTLHVLHDTIHTCPYVPHRSAPKRKLLRTLRQSSSRGPGEQIYPGFCMACARRRRRKQLELVMTLAPFRDR